MPILNGHLRPPEVKTVLLESTQSDLPCEQHSVMVGRKNPVLTGRFLQQAQAGPALESMHQGATVSHREEQSSFYCFKLDT